MRAGHWLNGRGPARKHQRCGCGIRWQNQGGLKENKSGSIKKGEIKEKRKLFDEKGKRKIKIIARIVRHNAITNISEGKVLGK